MTNKEATEVVFNFLKKEIEGLEIVDIDSYDEEDYSYIHFHINKCKGWLFGIWWHKGSDEGWVNGDLFAQYEYTINKFKPSCSGLITEVRFNESWRIEDIWIDLEFIECIMKRPALAFYIDMRERVPMEYIGRLKAWLYMKKTIGYQKRQDLKEKLVAMFILKGLRKYIAKNLPGCEIYDNGENCSPRYELRTLYKYYAEGELEVIDDRNCLGFYWLGHFGDVENKHLRYVANKIISRNKVIDKLFGYMPQIVSDHTAVFRDIETDNK